jgi:two-component system OmpR family response regulator
MMVRPLRILVIDDDCDTADSMAMLLQMREHQVAVAYNGISALLEASRCRPHVVVLDLGMPAMDGFEVARNLRSRLPNAILIALTGYTQETDKSHAREAGIDHYLVKPVDPVQLQGLIEAPIDS